MIIPFLLNKLAAFLPLSWRQKLDGLNTKLLCRMRRANGPLAMEPFFNIASVSPAGAPTTDQIGSCDCGCVIRLQDGVFYQEISPEVEEEIRTHNAEIADELKKHILLRRIKGVPYQLHCACCANKRREKGIVLKKFGTLYTDGMPTEPVPLIK